MSTGGLELHEVVKHFRAGEVVRAVDGVSLRVEPGELVALYGPSGSGKTTLLSIAGAFMAPDAGSVCFAGRTVTDFTAKERALYQRREVGLVQQRFHLNAGSTAIDNAAVKLLADRVSLEEARRRAIPWLERVGLGERLSHTPDRLSGGEGQRVALARALVNEPRLVLADEPTAHLDRRRGREVLTLLAQIAHERSVAVMVVTHDPEAAAVADRTHTLTDGRLRAGVPAEFAVSSASPALGAQP
ncbi:MAG TPA: ABC transporter ATP-binding protein [Gemmatimonadaceae bacterium]|nr:ABC transporter ATP-binding protein [Gemmatimonadaceae bacterium]